MIEILAQIDAPPNYRGNGFCAGLVARDDVVVEAAPIIQYLKGWSRKRVQQYCIDRGWRITVVEVKICDDAKCGPSKDSNTC